MATRLDAVAVADGRAHTGARLLADAAIAAGLRDADVEPGEVDILINCGLYRDRNLGEPALAALIQEDIGANPGHPPVGGHGTFSFDLTNGECGPIMALQIIDGLFATGAARLGVVVASDADPGHHLAPRFPFEPHGAAALLRPGPGFVAFGSTLFPEHAGLFRAEVRWAERARPGPLRPDHENVLVIDRAVDYAEQAVGCATLAAKDFLAAHHLDLADIDLVVTPHAGGVGPALADVLGRPAVVAGHGAHTAGVLMALGEAAGLGHLGADEQVLVITASAGIHVSCALHRARNP